METRTVDVSDMLTPLNAEGVTKQLSKLPGVHRADVSYVSASATIQFNETRTSLAEILKTIRECGFHCRGEMVPRHVCAGITAVPEHRHHAQHAGAAKPASPREMPQDMMHDMGHGAGMSMQNMVADMRNLMWSAPSNCRARPCARCTITCGGR